MYVIRKQLNWILAISLIGIFIFSLYIRYPKVEAINQSVIVTQIIHYDTYQRYTITTGIKSYHINSQNVYHVGDILNVRGDVETYRKQTVPGGFDSYKFNLGKGIQGQLRVTHMSLKYPSLLRRLDIKSVPFFDLFKDESFIETQWMSHLFKLSSIHLTFLIAILLKLMYYLDIENKGKYLIVSIMMSLVYFIGYSVIVLRMAIKYAIQYINLTFNLSIDNFNIECITCVLILIFQPYIIYNQSFLVIYILVLCMQLKPNNHHALTWAFIPMLIAPFLLYWHQSLSLLSLLVIPIFGVILKYTWIPLLLLASIIPVLNVLGFMQDTIHLIENFLINYDIQLYFIQLVGVMWIVYYLVVIYVVAAPDKKAVLRRFSIYLMLCVISFMYTFKPLEDSVTFLDVGQGDSAVIFKDNQVIVVDAFNNVERYLKYHYVYKIDYLIVTHADTDHMKELDQLLRTFEVKTLILNGYNDYDVMHPNIFYVRKDSLELSNNLGMKLLGPFMDFGNMNENSVVFQIEVGLYKYLFTGDIGMRTEKLYVETYGYTLKSDILKVPHHGSNTSSSVNFLSYVQPIIAVVSVSKRNVYNLPNDEVIERYLNYGIYLHQTKDFGSLKIQK